MIVDRLKGLLTSLSALEPFSWGAVQTWRSRALPLFRDSLPNHLHDFEEVTKTPNWTFVARFSSAGDQWTGQPPRDNFAKAEATERASNAQKASEARDRIASWLGGLIEELSANSAAGLPYRPRAGAGNAVFLVHGHDDAAKYEVARFLEKVGCTVTILHEQPSGGRTVIEKLEHNADVAFVVVLLTPDDFGRAKDDGSEQPRARQNVIMELGYFIGRLGRGRVCALVRDDVEKPSDYAGVVWVHLDSGAWKLALMQEMKAVGVEFNAAAAFG